MLSKAIQYLKNGNKMLLEIERLKHKEHINLLQNMLNKQRKYIKKNEKLSS